ncbi:MAG: hypothetical protein CMI73_02195 [Candidatus Pelagibacter sp.]|nr:hypothetical protein [Candidatus Pelagibacter sp.]OUV87705.1 MAG: hypothetical protein CBC96_01595 [Pelagibacteraceae bacterium TMED136]|tara:strand:+ start:255 stop:707 length:453 start_codon:yes stop_codon:yes gene_type:complete
MKKNRNFSSLKPIGALLPDNIKKLIKNNVSTNLDTLKKSWLIILGKKTAKKCELIKIQKYSNKNCIFLKVDRKFLIEIDYERDRIIEKINSFLGYEFATKILINFKDINSTQLVKKSLNLKEKTRNLIESVKDEELRKKLMNFSHKEKYE